ncbi:MAG: lipopolysaccharide heptosyltransferase II [Deltaproteobacteria bacterium]|nr:lipopolysaccharide heptosyltransferase II [Deltaproteobacteria bacterium]
MNHTSPRLLVAQTGFLGDVVLTTPLLATLHRHLSPSSLTVMTTPQAKPLLDCHPVVNQVLVDAKHTEGQGLLGLWCMAQRLRRERFTLAVAPHKSFRTALLLLLAGIPRRIGFRQSPGWFLYHHTAIRDPHRHEVERILCIMRVFGLEPEDCDRQPQVAYGHEARGKAEALLHEGEIDGTAPLFVVCPGSVWATKRWTVDGFAEVVKKLHRDYGRVLLCGGPDDIPIAQQVHERSGQCGVNLVGRADLQTFMALVDRARLVISNDSAPMHVAVARHVPVVAIFCATTPSLGYGPYSDRAVVVEKKDLFCRPCGRHGSPTCPRGTDDCMRQVTVADVFAGIDTLIVNAETKRTPVALSVHG